MKHYAFKLQLNEDELDFYVISSPEDMFRFNNVVGELGTEIINQFTEVVYMTLDEMTSMELETFNRFKEKEKED